VLKKKTKPQNGKVQRKKREKKAGKGRAKINPGEEKEENLGQQTLLDQNKKETTGGESHEI